MTARFALLWMTHVWNRELEAEFERFLQINYPGSPDVWLILDSSTPGAMDLARRYERCHVFRVNEMFQRLSYPRINNKTLYNHVHFPILDFFHSHSEYDHYWVIEFDVRYTGEWEILLRSFESFNQDLITKTSECPYLSCVIGKFPYGIVDLYLLSLTMHPVNKPFH